MKIITFQDIQSLNIPPEEWVLWAEEALSAKKTALLPPKISLKPRDGVFCNVMPSMIPVESIGLAGGVKAVTRYPGRVPSLESLILLMNADNGEFLALMDGTWITAMRTGAVAAHSIKLFAKKNFTTMGIMGLGNTSRAALLALVSQMPEKQLNIKLLKYKGQEEDFIKRFSGFDNLHFTVVDTAEEMVRHSDVVISGATYLPQDVCADECFEKGVLVVPIHTLGFTNCDLFFDKIYADDTGHVCHFKNFARFKRFAEVNDVITGLVPGRESDDERILVYNIGISIHDINFASRIYHMIQQKEATYNTLVEADMKNPTEKFWV